MNARAITLAAGVVVLAGVACNARLSLEGRSCPCTVEYVCCEASKMCISELERDFDQKTCATKYGSNQTSAKKTQETDEPEDAPREVEEPENKAGVSIATASDATCFATDDDAVYWVNGDGSIGAVRTSAGPAIVMKQFLVPAAPIDRCGLARTGGYLFATLEKGSSVLRLSVRREANGAITLGDTADRLGTFEEPIALAAVDEKTLYVAENTSKKIKRLDVTTGTTLDITTSAGPIRELLVANGALVWSGGSVATRASEPGTSFVSLSTQDDASNLVIKDDRVFYISGRVLWSAPLSGKSPAAQEMNVIGGETPSSGLESFDRFAFDGPKVVAVRYGRFYEAGLDGSLPRALFKTESTDTRFLHVDAKRYLWATSTKIWSASRPITR